MFQSEPAPQIDPAQSALSGKGATLHRIDSCGTAGRASAPNAESLGRHFGALDKGPTGGMRCC
jgi:hypothetical protein